MKRALLLLPALLLAAAPAALAQGKSDPKITLTWWINPWRIAPPGFPEGKAPTGDEFPRYISEQFMKLHPNVTVKYEVVPNQGFREKVTAAIFAGNPPDVIRPISFDPTWAKQGLLEPIDAYLRVDERTDFLPYTLEEGKYGGKYYLWPWNNSNNGMGSTLLLNPAIFKERKVALPKRPTRDWTLDEFLEVAKKLTFDRNGDGKTDVYAITLAAKDTENTLAWLHRFGAQLVNDEGTAFVINSPEGVRALQFMVDLIYKHKVAPEGASGLGVYDTIDNLHQGRAAMGYGGIYEIGRIDRYVKEGKLKNPIRVEVAPFPHDPKTGPVSYQTSGGFVVFKQKDAYKRKMAMELARFITSPKNVALLEDLLYFSARRSVNRKMDFKGVAEYTDVRPQVEVYLNALKHGKPYFGPSGVDVQPVMAHFTSAIQAALSRQKTPKAALDEFVATANRIVFKK
ncbi:multiple sugar transport system substrate-binding protein [Deinobacterium chartae]|uniref:Multiple sugar transport system substrate-binding protein n=1 Tax=Deinobacterium chartae TaxID=521158 RepID=A0A841HX24_9DEIO|nr:extracellular solute-binding protein [Deinobacterium chartae]MBB6096799.1 multiple sugar transport system substrate-binding protein [Deinobacterium chartae]